MNPLQLLKSFFTTEEIRLEKKMQEKKFIEKNDLEIRQ